MNRNGTIIAGCALAVLLCFGIPIIKTKAGSKTELMIFTSHGAINNPGNIMKSATVFDGEIVSPSSDMKSFRSMADGYAAMITILKSYYNSGIKTLYEWIKKYSGLPYGTNLDNYVAYVEEWATVNPYSDLGSAFDGEVIKDIVTGMSIFEQGSNFAVMAEWVDEGFNLAA